MKASEFITHIRIVQSLIQSTDGKEYAELIGMLMGMFKEQETKQINKLLEQLSNIKIEKNDFPTVNRILPTMKILTFFAEGACTAPLKKDIQAFYQFLESYKTCNIETLVMASQSELNRPKSSSKQKKPKSASKGKRKVNKEEIERIILRLKDIIGDADSFAKTYAELNIEGLSASEVREIAKSVNPKTKSNTSKKAALKIIKDRHDEVIKYHNTSSSMSGRLAG